ncbi:hypothetical protein SDC9_148538 [bioreactor metagenome]|uniref:Uncharacterized protein n=1 Tax=bioreactor metagenome TaxID=1076179 RepID=A0A645EJM1_9ZZZZ
MTQWDAVLGGASQGMSVRQVMGMMESMYGNSVIVRAFPAGVDQETCYFSGALEEPDSNHFDRAGALTRYGTSALPWTLVAQVAAATPRDDTTPQRAFSNEAFVVGERLDRVKLESLFDSLLRFMSDSGMIEAPPYPAVSVIPLAVYRAVSPFEGNFDWGDSGDD